MAGLGPGLAHADPNQTCTAPVWVTDMGIPIGSRTTCFNPDGSYQVCTSHGTAGNGPGTCINYPAAPAPAPGGLLTMAPARREGCDPTSGATAGGAMVCETTGSSPRNR
jgi:hypothetical protein